MKKTWDKMKTKEKKKKWQQREKGRIKTRKRMTNSFDDHLPLEIHQPRLQKQKSDDEKGGRKTQE